MYGKLKRNIREIIRKLCDYKNVEIVERIVLKESYSSFHKTYVFKHQIYLKISPKLSVSEFMGYLKEKKHTHDI